ncbi:hypothetical protein ACFVUS_20010 [Nocardia sp. NPDC058058]|uniref:hypothetical protein n=1 Tax=Nocardia sp. NPDC058058 TaxID=3346317 RepID=UPI0036DEF9C8
MKKTLAVTALALAAAGLGAGVAHAEELQVDGSYGSVQACDADGTNGSFQAGGVNLRGEDGWRYRCDQGNDGLWYMTIFR